MNFANLSIQDNMCLQCKSKTLSPGLAVGISYLLIA